MKTKILHRHFIVENLSLLSLCLGSSLGIYLLVDLFDRLDNFLNKGSPPSLIIKYFLLKIPLIISQIFPLVFFLTLIIQLSLMRKNREIEALEASGINFSRIIQFIIGYCIVFCIIQLFFSQYIAINVQREVRFIWDNLGKKHVQENSSLKNIWFRKGKYIGFIKELSPEGRAREIRIYEIKRDFSAINKVIVAPSGRVKRDSLLLKGPIIFSPEDFSTRHKKTLLIHAEDIVSLLHLSATSRIEDISLWKLKGLIRELKRSGSNVEEMLTVWYGKLAYGFSLLFLAMGAIVITLRSENMALNISIGLGICFLFYGITVLGNVLGRHGIVPPFIGAWGANILFGGVFSSLLIIRRMKP